MSMNSDIVKGVVGTSDAGYKTFGDIKLYGGNVYKVANDVTTPAAVGRFCYVRPVDGVLTATKPYYTTSATTSPVKDEEASLLCNGYVLEVDSVTSELYVAMSGVLSMSTVPETAAPSLDIVTGSSYYIDWGVEASPVDTVRTTEELVVNTFLGDSGVSSSNYPVLRGSLQRVAYATSEKTVSLLFPQRDSDGETALFDSLTLAARLGSSVLRTSFRNDGLEGLIVDSDDDVQVRINTRDLGADASAKFRVRSGSSSADAFVVKGDGAVEIPGKLTRSDGDPLILDAASVVISNSKTAGTSSLTIRDTVNSEASISLIEGDGVFGGSSNYGARFIFDGGSGGTNSLLLQTGNANATPKDVFSVHYDSNDIVFKGIAECDPSTSLQGGFRSANFGGSTASPNAVYFTTESSDGHFNSQLGDTGTFTLNGPAGSGGKLRLYSKDLDLYSLGSIRLDTASAGDIILDASNGSVDIDAGQTGEITLNTNNGDIIAVAGDSGEAKMRTLGSGDITLEAALSGTINLLANGGDIHSIVGGSNDFTVEMTNGEFRVLDGSDVARLRVLGDTGDLKFNLSDREADINSINGYRVLAISNQGVVYKSDTEASSDLNFTGTHVYLSEQTLEVGYSVSLGTQGLELTSSASQKDCVGIIQRSVTASPDFTVTTSLGQTITSGEAYFVASVGDSIKGDLQGFKVCDEGGAISSGDLLVTSSTPGRLMKQADDIIRSSTVGKAMQDVTFNDSGEADDIYGFIYCG